MATSHSYAAHPRGLTRTRTFCVTVFRRALSTVILPVVMTATTIMASLEHGPVRVYWSIGIAAAVLINGVISLAKDRNAVTVSTPAVDRNLAGLAAAPPPGWAAAESFAIGLQLGKTGGHGS